MGIGTMNQTKAPTAPVTVPSTVDFDTRLMLAAVGIDILLEAAGGQELRDAHAAVTAAIADADRYGAEAATLAALAAVQRPQTYRSHPILKAAGDIIRSRGWHQGSWADERGAVCALAAIRIATGGDTGQEADAVAVLLDRIRGDLGQSAHSVPGWNDSSSRSASDVLVLLF